MADERMEGEGEKNIPKAKSGPNLIMVIAVLLVIQAVVAFVVVMFALPKTEDNLASELRNPANAQTEANLNEVILPISIETVVTIAGTDGTRFLRARIYLAYDSKDPANRRIEQGLVGIETQIRGKVNEYLSSISFNEVTNPDMRSGIRSSLLREINSVIPSNIGRLSNLHILEFIVN